MSAQIRSADLLVKTVLSDQQTLNSVKQNPESTLKSVAKDVIASLPQPDAPTSNAIWIIIICTFALVMLWAAYVLGSGVTAKLEADATYVTKGDTILTVFTTVVGFLAGLLSPSPLKK